MDPDQGAGLNQLEWSWKGLAERSRRSALRSQGKKCVERSSFPGNAQGARCDTGRIEFQRRRNERVGYHHLPDFMGRKGAKRQEDGALVLPSPGCPKLRDAEGALVLAIFAAAGWELGRGGRQRGKERSRTEDKDKQTCKDSAHSVFRVQEALKGSKGTAVSLPPFGTQKSGPVYCGTQKS